MATNVTLKGESPSHWWFLVKDTTRGTYVASGIAGGDVLMVEMDPLLETSSSTTFASGDRVANAPTDMWHIYALGYHWIATTQMGVGVYLYAVENSGGSFRTVASATIVNSGTFSFNDVFIVETPTGVAVGVWNNDPSVNQVVLFDCAVTIAGSVSIAAPTQRPITATTLNTSGSGTFDGRNIRVVAPNTYNSCAATTISEVTIDASWSMSVRTLLSDPGYSFLMPMLVDTPLGRYKLLLVKRVPLNDCAEVQFVQNCNTCGPMPYPGCEDDAGELVIYVLDSAYRTVREVQVLPYMGNRPHILQADGYVFVAYSTCEMVTDAGGSERGDPHIGLWYAKYSELYTLITPGGFVFTPGGGDSDIDFIEPPPCLICGAEFHPPGWADVLGPVFDEPYTYVKRYPFDIIWCPMPQPWPDYLLQNQIVGAEAWVTPAQSWVIPEPWQLFLRSYERYTHWQ